MWSGRNSGPRPGRLPAIRQELRKKIGTAFNDISDMPGGGSQGKKGKEDDMQSGSILGAILDFAEASRMVLVLELLELLIAGLIL